MNQASPRYRFADLHCHPNLKTFGHSFSGVPKSIEDKSHIWHRESPTTATKILNTLTGLTKFSQADFTTLCKANVKIAFVSLYPFEKGFFINGQLNGPISAQLANLVTSVGYKRIRHIQNHVDYYEDLTREKNFLTNSSQSMDIDGKIKKWTFTNTREELENVLRSDNEIAVITTIEGAHILNTGLSKYGRELREEEVLDNVRKLKRWKNPPLFITFAHNFNNDLCGHARSLDPLGPLVNQFDNLNKGFSELGKKVIRSLLDNDPESILIDIKHMSVKSRKEFFNILNNEYSNNIPLIVSHGAVTGVDFKGNRNTGIGRGYFCNDDINFYDEELINIAVTKGLFAIQLDGNRLAPKKILKKSVFNFNDPRAHEYSSMIIWRQLQHIAEVLDRSNQFAWGTTSIGSDFDGTINPLKGIWTAEYMPLLADQLLLLADRYLKAKNPLLLPENNTITAEEIVEKFIFENALSFLKRNLN